ncbi:uncharacterized protein LTR77_008657 [Saxophila tyrrhenica]|uniref:Uncharacterized protein n=1 Tax=Saxophila tyrrhenica TaxID=1690608 RepID=A0AAV9P3Y8_9PEZI|nr:hypothetical protein LTR77_008657 [Saxophila tyrrhenica]
MHMRFLLSVFGLVLCSPSTFKTLAEKSQPPRAAGGYHGEPAFGIEFTLDHVLASVTLANTSTYAVAKVHGGEAYQNVMRQYLGVCHQAHLTQSAPIEGLQEAWERAREKERERQHQLIRDPESSWWHVLEVFVPRRPTHSPSIFDTDEFVDDADAAVLAAAIKDLKSSMEPQMKRQFNITSIRPWEYAKIAVPDFFFTTIKPRTDSEIFQEVSWMANDNLESLWYWHITRKFSAAVYRNRFRLDESSYWRQVLDAAVDAKQIRPAAYNTLSYTEKHHCVSPDHKATSRLQQCGPKTLSPTSIVIDFSNASLSLWLEGPRPYWTPWSTFPEFGGHTFEGRKSRDGSLEEHWDQTVAKVDDLSKGIDAAGRTVVDVILSGEAWSEKHLLVFGQRLQANQEARMVEIANVVRQPDVFAASKQAARQGHLVLYPWYAEGHDEL